MNKIKSGLEVVWDLRLAEVAENLRENNFKVDIFNDLPGAVEFFKTKILPELSNKSVAVGGSQTVTLSGIYDILNACANMDFINPYAPGLSQEDLLLQRRQAFSADLYITSSNAVTRQGSLVNLDGLGNRVAAMIYGPTNVLLFVGRNKICEDMESAISHITEFSAPANSIRLSRKTPCVKTGSCMDCKSPERICNAWSVIEKSNPAGRIHVLLINQDLGF